LAGRLPPGFLGMGAVSLNRPEMIDRLKIGRLRFPKAGNLPAIPFQGKIGVEFGSALPRIKDNKTIGVADEDAPEEYCGQQSILPGG
jgi:hypothetical protein